MIRRVLLTVVAVGSITASVAVVRQVSAFDQLWTGMDGDWNTAANWEFGVPRQSLQDQAVIGAESPGTPNGGVANLSGPTFAVGGVILGRDAGTSGTLNLLPGAVLNNQPVTGITNGFVTVGAGGRGYLNMTGGSLSAVGLALGGEQIDPVSAIDLSGSSSLNIMNSSGVINLNGNLRVTGPTVDFDTDRPVNLQSSNNFTAEITAATHSPIKTAGNLTLAGGLMVEFNGVTPTPGQAWDLFDFGGGLSGGFSNLTTSGDVSVSGVPEPGIGSAYRLRRENGGENGNLLQIALEELLVLQVNRDTGELSIANPFGGQIGIDGYTIESRTAGSLLSSYKGISGAPADDTDWQKVGLSAGALAELKEDGTGSSVFDLTSESAISLGMGFDKFAVADNVDGIGVDGEDLVFHYTSPLVNGGRIQGHVEYVGTKFNNNLVLRVNPDTGEALIKNDSETTLTFDGYSILSSNGALDGTGFSGLGGTWESSPATLFALTQTNLAGSTTLGPDEELSLGNISTGALTDSQQAGLSMEFILSVGLEPTVPLGDYNENGFVDAADYSIWRDNLDNEFVLPNENPDAVTPGVVDQEDYDFWKQQFGTLGRFLPETSFRDGDVFFDSAGGGLAAATIPEPSTGLLSLLGLLAVFTLRQMSIGPRRPQPIRAVVASVWTGRQIGVANMSRQNVGFLAALVGVIAGLLLELPAVAQTRGIPLENQNFNLPGGSKVVPFDENGGFTADVVPGWIFSGPGMETRFNPVDEETGAFLIIGDSSIEPGGGFGAGSGTHLTLSTLDGTVYQTSDFNVIDIPATQAYRVNFQAFDAFTIDGNDPFEQITDRAELTAWLYYENGGVRTPIATEAFNLVGGTQTYTVEIDGGSGALDDAIGHPIGVEFDTTSIEFNMGTEFPVAHSWVAVDNVLLQIAGVLDGDLNGDGVVNTTDYGIVRDNQQLTGDYLAEGELTGDGIVNLNDFRAFRNIFDALPGAGAGSGALAGANVPEPSTALLALLLASAIPGSRLLRGLDTSHSRRMVLLGALAIGGAATAGTVATADLLYYDPFLIGENPSAGEYTLGPIVGQNPAVESFFTGPWTQGQFAGDPPEQAVIETSLSYLGTESPGGAVSGTGRVGRFLTEDWDASTVDTFYMSFQAMYGTAADPQGTDGGDGNLGFRTTEFWPVGNEMQNDTGRSEVGFQGFAGDVNQQIPSSALMRWIPGGGNTAPHFLTDIPFNDFNTTHLVVMKFELTDQADQDTISVFLDPTDSVEPETPTQMETGLNYTLNAMSTISFFGNAAGQLPIFDELRIGTEYADVLPELPCAGDTNGDCEIDINDYNVIAANFNRLDASGPAQGDVAGVNGRLGSDGRVDLRDYRLWRNNRTDVSGAGDLAGLGIPEPSSWLLCLAVAIALSGCARRWR